MNWLQPNPPSVPSLDVNGTPWKILAKLDKINRKIITTLQEV